MSAPPTNPLKTRLSFPGWPLIFALVALEALIAAGILVSLPSDPGGRFLGLSANRLAMVGLLFFCALAFAFLSAKSRQPGWLAGRLRPGFQPSALNILFVFLPLLALACLLIPLTLHSLYRTSGEFHYFAYYERLLPLFAWALLASLEIFAALFWSGQFQWRVWQEQRPVFRAALVVWAIFGLLALFVARTGIGLLPDRIGWGLPTVSLMEWHIWLAWAVGAALLLWMAYRGWNARRDGLLALAIWLLAAGIWLSQPILPAFFATAGRAPNFEMYPFSDGAYYDHFAQSVLIGNGFKGTEIPARPMYVTLLAGFHLLAGQKYAAVVLAQTLLLAFFPVVLFFLGKALHSRAAGVAVALLVVLREVTAINAMPVTDNASNSKLFFADLPAALAVSLWVLLVVLWLKGEGRRPWLPFLVGGSLGFAMLFRTQSMFMLPAVLLIALFVYRWNWSRWLGSVALVLLGLALTLSPYLLRNWAVTGRLVFDDDKSQTGSMAQRYSLSGYDEQYIYRPGEDPAEYSRRVTQGIFSFLRAHPDVVAGFVSAHWINAEIDNLLVLPVRYGIAEPRELLSPLRPTWQDWNGTLDTWQLLLFAINTALVALGIGAAWARVGWAGLVPLLANLSYNASNALARNSGGRYLLVADWVTLVYAALALMEITITVLAVLRVPPEKILPHLARRSTATAVPPAHPGAVQLRRQWRVYALLALVFLLVGSLPGLLENAIPPRYPPQTPAELLQEALSDESFPQLGVDRAALEQFAAQPGAVVVKGRALYPRYYDIDQGEPRTAKTGYEPLPYARTVFVVTSNTYNGLSILKMSAAPPFFPNASDVIIIGCQVENYLDAHLLLVLSGPGAAYRSNSPLPTTCYSLQ